MTPENCVKCKASLLGGEIPEDIREHYSPPYHWSRVIGIEVRGLYDGVLYYKCPDCQHIWKRLDWPDVPEYNVLSEDLK